jgi:acyl-CoA synthetase (AMP-forming)/AMP-acid ligase II
MYASSCQWLILDSYGEVHRAAGQVVAHLQQTGLFPHLSPPSLAGSSAAAPVVALVADLSPGYVAAVLGSWVAGAVLMPLYGALDVPSLAHCLRKVLNLPLVPIPLTSGPVGR